MNQRDRLLQIKAHAEAQIRQVEIMLGQLPKEPDYEQEQEEQIIKHMARVSVRKNKSK